MPARLSALPTAVGLWPPRLPIAAREVSVGIKSRSLFGAELRRQPLVRTRLNSATRGCLVMVWRSVSNWRASWYVERPRAYCRGCTPLICGDALSPLCCEKLGNLTFGALGVNNSLEMTSSRCGSA